MSDKFDIISAKDLIDFMPIFSVYTSITQTIKFNNYCLDFIIKKNKYCELFFCKKNKLLIFSFIKEKNAYSCKISVPPSGSTLPSISLTNFLSAIGITFKENLSFMLEEMHIPTIGKCWGFCIDKKIKSVTRNNHIPYIRIINSSTRRCFFHQLRHFLPKWDDYNYVHYKLNKNKILEINFCIKKPKKGNFVYKLRNNLGSGAATRVMDFYCIADGKYLFTVESDSLFIDISKPFNNVDLGGK